MPTLALLAVMMVPTADLPDDPPPPKRALVTKVFSVSDLVSAAEVTAPGQGRVAKAAGETNADSLMKLVTTMVRPYSWAAMGGQGSVDYFETGSGLVVKNTPDVIKEVGDLLEALRRLNAAKAAAPRQPAPPPSPPPPARLNQVVKLRSAAAADVVAALHTYLGEKDRANAVVVAEPVSNTVLVAAEPRLHGELVRLIARIDTPPQQVVIQAMVMQVRAGFLEDIGLTDDPKATNVLTLTPREVNVLNTQIRHAKTRGETMDILSRPQIQVVDGQTGFVQVGQQYPYLAVTPPDGKGGTKQTIEYIPIGVSMRVTPRIDPSGKVLMRVEPQVSTVAPTTIDLGNGVKAPAFNVQTMQSTVVAADGQTVVLHGLIVKGPAPCSDAGPFTGLLNLALPPARDEIVIVLTPHVVRPEKDKPKVEPPGRE